MDFYYLGTLGLFSVLIAGLIFACNKLEGTQ